MNKNIFYYFIAALLIISGCSKSNISSFSDNLDRHAPIFHAVFANKESKTYIENRDNRLELYWTADDRISIFNGDNVNQVYVFIGETGSNSAEFLKDRSAISVRGEDEYKFTTNYSVYPHSQQTSISNDALISVNLPEVQYYAEKSFGPGANTMVAVTSNLEDYFLAFKNLCGYLVVKLYGTGSVRSVKLCGKNGEKISGKALVTARYGEVPMMSMDENASETIVVDCGESGVALSPSAENPSEFWFCVPPTEFNNGFTISITGTDGTTVEKSVSSSRTIIRNIVNSLSAIEVDFASAPASPEIVDLGLSVKWASFNVGATKPEEYGDYYAWGETSEKSDCSFATYKYGKSGCYIDDVWYNDGYTKYVIHYWYGFGEFTDGKTVLDPEDDVAHVTWGSTWRIPTKAEFEELVSNCTSEWTSLNGVEGIKFTSNKNGNSIFLPASGYRYSTVLGAVGGEGNYWSSSLSTDSSSCAWDLLFSSGYVLTDGRIRHYGHSVRPVSE